MRIIDAANFIVANIFRAQLVGQAVDRLIGLLRYGFLHLHLQNQVRAALQIQPELDLVREVRFQVRHRGRKRRHAQQAIEAPENDDNDKNGFPLQIRMHRQRLRAFSGSWWAYFASSDASTCVIAERAMRIFTGDEPVSAIFRITVSPSMPLITP